MTQTFPLPITPAMLARANPHEGKPRYDSAPNVAADWHGGAGGNDVDHAEAMQAVANRHSANVEIDYDPQHQEDKGKNMNPVLTPLSDLGKDYGVNGSGTYRNGTIQPRQPYPSAALADEPQMSAKSAVAPILTQTFPLPITAAMLAKANQHEGKPRYNTPADWSQGAFGNDIDIATLSTPVVTSASADTVTPYPTRTQVAKGAAMVPPRLPLGDLGKDYGTYAGSTGRTGTIEPRVPYSGVSGGGGGALTAWPDATNTGVPVGTTLTPNAGPCDSTAAGQLIDARDITGPVTIAHNNVTLQRCKVTVSTAFACVNILDGVTGVTIQDCTIDGVGGSAIRGISGGGTFLRNNISRTEDGIYIRGSNTLVQDNYIHTLLSSYGDPHYDGIVNDGGFNSVTIRHNRVNNPFGQTSCVMIDNFFGAINTVTVENNYLTGAGSNVFVDAQFSGTNLITNVTVKNNLLGAAVQGFYAVTGATPTFTGNYSTRGYYIDGDVPSLVGTQVFAPTTAVTAASDRNDSTGFRVAATLAAAIQTEFRLVFYTGSTATLVLTGVAFGKQSSGQVATAVLTPVTFGGSTATSPIIAMQHYVVSDWMPRGALTFGVGDVMLVGFSMAVPGGTCSPGGNSNATSYFGAVGNMTVASPGYTAIPNACYGLAWIETR